MYHTFSIKKMKTTLLLFVKITWKSQNTTLSQHLQNPIENPSKGVSFGLALFMVFNATFNDISVISCRSVLLEEETGVPGENHRPVPSHSIPFKTQNKSFLCHTSHLKSTKQIILLSHLKPLKHKTNHSSVFLKL